MSNAGDVEQMRQLREKLEAIERRKWWQVFNFGWFGKTITIITAIAVILGGLGEFVHGIDAGCKWAWWSQGCPK
jgi:hypothetical protein